MKKLKIAYWVVTIIFSAFMIYSSVPGLTDDAQVKSFLGDLLGYPDYFIRFISAAKIIGALAILVPGLNRIKEWAYAGLFFDLAGAVYSVGVKVGVKAEIIFILLPVIFLFASYFLWHRTKNSATA